jgi:ABC transport system ATP-binding/permease protein
LLARLLARPANLMVLEYSGTLILVTNDRTFLDNLVTSTLVLFGDGQVSELIGGYDDWKKEKDEKQKKEI